MEIPQTGHPWLYRGPLSIPSLLDPVDSNKNLTPRIPLEAHMGTLQTNTLEK